MQSIQLDFGTRHAQRTGRRGHGQRKSRADALRDGVLFEVSATTREAGKPVKTALSPCLLYRSIGFAAAFVYSTRRRGQDHDISCCACRFTGSSEPVAPNTRQLSQDNPERTPSSDPSRSSLSDLPFWSHA